MTIFNAGDYGDTVGGRFATAVAAAVEDQLAPHPRDYGAVGDGVTDDTEAFQAFIDAMNASNYKSARWDGTFLVSKMIDGTKNAVGDGPGHWYGDLTLVGNASDFDHTDGSCLFKMDKWAYVTFYGQLSFYTKAPAGGTVVWTNYPDGASMGDYVQVGLWRINCREQKYLGGLSFIGFPMWGMYDSSGGNSSLCYFGRVAAGNCGSGSNNWNTGYSVYADATAAANDVGVFNNSNQRTTVTVDVLPPDFVDDWSSNKPGRIYVQFEDNNEIYNVMSFDREAGTLAVFPYLDATTLASVNDAGVRLRYFFGGGIQLDGADDNVHVFEQLDFITCGIGMAAWSLYEPIVHNYTAQLNGIALICQDVAGAGLGGRYSNLYMENNRLDIWINNNQIDSGYRIFDGEYALSPKTVRAGRPSRLSDNTIAWTNASFPQTSMTYFSKQLQWRNIIEYAGGSRPLRPAWGKSPVEQEVRSATLDVYCEDLSPDQISVMRLYGMNTLVRRVFHPTTGGAPTTLTFTIGPFGSPANPTPQGFEWWDGDTATVKTYTSDQFTGPVTFVLWCDAPRFKWHIVFLAGFNNAKAATTQTGATYTITGTDRDATVILSNASAVTVTVPTNAANPLPIGYRTSLFAAGAGGLSLSTTGLTFTGATSAATGGRLNLEKVATDSWLGSA